MSEYAFLDAAEAAVRLAKMRELLEAVVASTEPGSYGYELATVPLGWFEEREALL